MKKILCLFLAYIIICLCGCSTETSTENNLSSEEEFFLENEYNGTPQDNGEASSVASELKKYSGTWYGFGTDGEDAVTPGRTLTFLDASRFKLGEEVFVLIAKDTAESVADHETGTGDNNGKILLEFGNSEDGEPALASCLINKTDRQQISEIMCYYRQTSREAQGFIKGLNTKPVDSEPSPKPDPVNYEKIDFQQRYNILKSKEVVDGPQMQMNISSGEIYEEWDILLNEVYQYLKSTLPSGEFEALKKDEIKWIQEKETAMEETEAEYYGGSMMPLMVNGIGIEYTSSRCRYLISLIK